MDVQNFFAQKKIGGVQKCTQKYESEARHIFMFQEMCDGRDSFFQKNTHFDEESCNGNESNCWSTLTASVMPGWCFLSLSRIHLSDYRTAIGNYWSSCIVNSHAKKCLETPFLLSSPAPQQVLLCRKLSTNSSSNKKRKGLRGLALKMTWLIALVTKEPLSSRARRWRFTYDFFCTYYTHTYLLFLLLFGFHWGGRLVGRAFFLGNGDSILWLIVASFYLLE